MELRNLIDVHLDLPRLAKDLDELGQFGRLWSVNRWSRDDQAKVFEAAKGFRPVALDDFVPPSVAPRTEVVHHGKNSLPTASHFAKHFFKPSPSETEPKDVLIGRNFQALSVFSGPGFYVARKSTENGEVDLDYTMTPGETLASWGAVRSNAGGISHFVYHGMVDVMRGLSSHVTVGRLKKKGQWLDNWFVLVREDPANDNVAPAEPHEPGAAP